MLRSSEHLLQRVSSLGDTHGRSMPAKVVKVHEDIVSSYQLVNAKRLISFDEPLR